MSDQSTNATRLMAWWSFERLLFSPRSLGMALLVTMPVIVALVFRALLGLGFDIEVNGFSLFSVLSATLVFQFVSPMLALFYGTGILSDDIEQGTMRYLLTRPRSRASLLAGKMVGSIAIQLALLLPALLLCFYIAVGPTGWDALGARFPSLLVNLVAAILGAAAYNSLFSLLACSVKRPLLVGLFFVFGWQAGATYVPGVARKLTIAHYLQSLLVQDSFDATLQNLVSSPSSTWVAVASLAAVTVVASGLAIFIFERKEIL